MFCLFKLTPPLLMAPPLAGKVNKRERLLPIDIGDEALLSQLLLTAVTNGLMCGEAESERSTAPLATVATSSPAAALLAIAASAASIRCASASMSACVRERRHHPRHPINRQCENAQVVEYLSNHASYNDKTHTHSNLLFERFSMRQVMCLSEKISRSLLNL